MRRYEYGKTLKSRAPENREDRRPIVLPLPVFTTFSAEEIAERYQADREIEDITIELDWADRWPRRPK